MKCFSAFRSLYLLAPAGIIIAIFVAMMISMVRFSFAPGQGGIMQPGLTLEHYARFLGSAFYMGYLARSFWISFYCTIITAFLGYIIAYFMYRSGHNTRIVVISVLIVQFFTAYVIRIYAVMLVIGQKGLLNDLLLSFAIIEQPLRLLFTEEGVAIGLVLISIPFMVFPIFASMHAIPANLEIAAVSLGANTLQRFWTVTFPCSLPGIAAGFVIVYLFQVTSYIVPGLLGGGFVDMIANLIYNKAMQSFEYAFASAIAVITLIVSGFMVYFMNKVFSYASKYESR